MAAIAIVAASAMAAVPAVAGQNSTKPVGSARDHYSAVIRRTEYGIPHVLGANLGDAGYGYGYAFAQDDICALADLVVTADGDRSRYFGQDTPADDPLAGTLTNLDGDVYHRWINDSGVVERTMNQPAPLGLTAGTRALLDGYVAGVNRYLADMGVARLPDPSCRAKPWVHPISATEIERVAYGLNQYGGTGSFEPQIATATPGKPAGGAVPSVANPASAGSNGIAVGRAGTDGHDGMLLANPHFPWAGSARFYQIQLTVPGVLDMTGGSLYGTPVIEIGHNRSVAWTHTVSTADRFTLFALHLVPGDPTSYLVDGHREAMVRRPVSVPVPGGTVTRTVYTSRYGPVLGTNWTATTALAIKGAGADNGRSLNEWLAMGQADSVAGLRAAQNRYQGIPFTNTIATDSAGTAYFADASVVPNVTDDKIARCAAGPPRKGKLAAPILDGSTSACGWGNSPDAIIPGIFGPSSDPTLTRADFVTNSNDSFWLTNPAAPITNIPRIYGDTGTERLPRTRMDLIGERLAGTDGLGRRGFTVPAMQRALLTDRNESAELARDAVVSMCRANPTLTATDGTKVDVSAACPVHAAWDTRDNPDSRGAVLWRQFWLSAGSSPIPWLVPFDPANPATTPNTLNTADPGVRRAFADAVERMRALRLPLAAPLSAAQVTEASGKPVAVPGCGEAEGCYNIADTQRDPNGTLQDDGRFPSINHGSSFVMVAELSPHGVSARTILTYSESTNPESPHHGDQTALFAAKRWVTDRYTERDIRTDPHLSITMLN